MTEKITTEKKANTVKPAECFLRAGISFYNNLRLFDYFLASRIIYPFSLMLWLCTVDVPICLLSGFPGLLMWSVGCMLMLITLVNHSEESFDACDRAILSIGASFTLACIGGFFAWFICYLANLDNQHGWNGLLGGYGTDIVVFFVSAILVGCNDRPLLERVSAFLGYDLVMRGRLLFLTSQE
jgi:hypothetical protein